MLLPGIAGRNSCPTRKLPRVWPIDVKGTVADIASEGEGTVG